MHYKFCFKIDVNDDDDVDDDDDNDDHDKKEMCNSIANSLYKDKGQNDRYNDIKL